MMQWTEKGTSGLQYYGPDPKGSQESHTTDRVVTLCKPRSEPGTYLSLSSSL